MTPEHKGTFVVFLLDGNNTAPQWKKTLFSPDQTNSNSTHATGRDLPIMWSYGTTTPEGTIRVTCKCGAAWATIRENLTPIVETFHHDGKHVHML